MGGVVDQSDITALKCETDPWISSTEGQVSTTKPETTTASTTKPSPAITTANTTTKEIIKPTTAPSGQEFKPTPSHKIDDSLTYCSEGDNGFGSGRIIGGTYASRNSWPSTVAIRVLSADGSEHQCGGTIIANHWVVTAAHCQGLNSSVR